MKKKTLLSQERCPICLHTLGQPLVETLYKEGRELLDVVYRMSSFSFKNIEGMKDFGPELRKLVDKHTSKEY